MRIFLFRNLFILCIYLALGSCSKSYNKIAENPSPVSKTNTKSLDLLLRGASGVQVNGEGANAKISIRGINSFSAGTEPLFLVNGTAYTGRYSDLFSRISTADIKDIYVLKDAGSTAIYGVRRCKRSYSNQLENPINFPPMHLSFVESARTLNLTSIPFIEFFKHGSLVIELYKPDKIDRQTPHLQDEVYIIAEGFGNFNLNGKVIHFQKNDVLFVPAGIEHRFESFSDDFCTWVIFYGPKGGESIIN